MRSLGFSLVLAIACPFTSAQTVDVDARLSSITIKVEKSGLFSAFAHNHTIQAPVDSGKLDSEKRTALLVFDAKQMKVLDQDVKDSERAEIDQTMKSEKVLDVKRFPEIRFVSTSITPRDGGRYLAQGDVTLHGITRPVEALVTFSKGRYSGSVKLKQTDFGITPVSIAGGAVKVKDVIEISFEIVPGGN